MRIITIKMSEEGRDDIVVTRVEIADHDYAESYYMSVRDGFIKFPAFTILELTIEDEPTIYQKVVKLEEELGDEILDALDKAEDDIIHNRTPARFDDYVTDDETGEKRGIVYPENAAPELDAARSLVADAAAELRSRS